MVHFFLTEYLRCRKQRVILDNVISESVDVLSGVPQGSILGPLLFVLFINDIYENINKDSNIALFADDTKIWRDINSESDCKPLQNDINTLSIWSRNNKMSFHPLLHPKLCPYTTVGLILLKYCLLVFAITISVVKLLNFVKMREA